MGGQVDLMDARAQLDMMPRKVRADEQPCPCRATHEPGGPWNDEHHVLPLEYGGPDTTANKTVMCGPSHDWVHVVLRASKRARIFAPRPLGMTRYAYRVARMGWERMVETGVVEPL